MNSNTDSIGTVISDQETPTFENIRIKLKAGQDVKPGTLVRVPASRNNINSTLIGIRSAHEQNPQENPNVRDTLGMEANYPAEEDSTTIYRLKLRRNLSGKPCNRRRRCLNPAQK